MFDYMKDPDNRIIVSKLPANAVSGSGCRTVGNFAREIFFVFLLVKSHSQKLKP